MPEEKTLSLEQVMDLRQRILNGEELPAEDVRAAIRFLRQDRFSAAMSKKPKGEGKKAPTMSSEELSKLLGL